MPYGKKGLSLDLPGMDVTLIQRRPMAALDDAPGVVMAAFDCPVGCETLFSEARGSRSACILVCDITRPVPNSLILPPLVRVLLDAGIPADNICIVIATGLHRPNLNEELKELIGDESILKTVKIFNHFARDGSCHMYMGKTPGGLPVRLDKRFVEADLRIVTGLVEPHFMAGYSGGRKVIVPGIAHQDTIRALHSARQLVRAGVTNCVLDGNPFHEEQIQAARMAGKSYAVNTLLNDDRKLCFVNFGSLEESHMAAVAFGRNFFVGPSGPPLQDRHHECIRLPARPDLLSDHKGHGLRPGHGRA